MDVYKIVEEMRTEPKTYKTIFGTSWKNCSEQVSVRRKLNKFFKEGTVWRTLISLNQMVFYHPEKDYTLFFEQNVFRVEVYYCREYHDDGVYVHLRRPYKLSGMTWEKWGDVLLDKERLLKVV